MWSRSHDPPRPRAREFRAERGGGGGAAALRDRRRAAAADFRSLGVGDPYVRWSCTQPCKQCTEQIVGVNRFADKIVHTGAQAGLPVFGEGDGKALALAEGWLGAAKGVDNFMAMVVSTGVGGGIVLNGRLLDGASGNAGHIGHVVVEPNGRRCACGGRGCLEAEASGPAIEAITGRPPTQPTYEIMVRTGRLVGRAVASVCNLLDLKLVCVGGSVALGFGATFFTAAQRTVDELCGIEFARGARVVPVRLGDDGPVIGASAVGWRGLNRSAAVGAK